MRSITDHMRREHRLDTTDGVMVTGCRQNDCYFRFGNRWTRLRFSGERKPGLRARADRDRILIHGAAEPDAPAIERDLDEFRQHLRDRNRSAAIGIEAEN